MVEGLHFTEREAPVADRLLEGIRERLRVLESVGVDYLSLDRATTTLSGGEARRIRLAGQIGARMQGCSTCWTSLPSACTRATTSGCWTRCAASATWATRSWSSSTTSRPSARPTRSTWAKAPAPAADG